MQTFCRGSVAIIIYRRIVRGYIVKYNNNNKLYIYIACERYLSKISIEQMKKIFQKIDILFLR